MDEKARNVLASIGKSNAELSALDTGLAEIAEDVLPELWDHQKAPEYREDVIAQFLENDGQMPREHGRVYSQDERRLLDAWTDVAQKWNTSESNVRNCVLRMYHDANPDNNGPIEEFDTTTRQFLEHLKEIEARWERDKSDRRSKC